MAKRPEKGRAILYTRDSEGRERTTFEEYVRWCQQKAKELGLEFHATEGQIDAMIRSKRYVDGDIIIDFGIAGDELDRPGLKALFAIIERDKHISHVLCPRRDRLTRATDPAESMRLENHLSRLGVWLVFLDDTVPPIKVGDAPEIDRLVKSVVGSYTSSKEVRELARKSVFAKLRLARDGHSAGGRAPFGFERWLVDAAGRHVERIADKHAVSGPGCHVDWLPTDEEKLHLVRRIFGMLDEGLSASRVASILTAEGVPTPDFKRRRTDGGYSHPTSGIWHITMVVSLARNPAYAGLLRIGRRSMGKYSRFTPEGPRQLSDEDFRDDGRPKVVQNLVKGVIEAPGHFTPPVPRDQWERVNQLLDVRAGVQRGRTRRRRPEANPLQGRLFDLHCSWPMYRSPNGKRFRYVCGNYVQSQGAQCSHNAVDCENALRFVLSYTRDQVLRPDVLQKVRARLTEIARKDLSSSKDDDSLRRLQHRLSELDEEIELNVQNLARAKSGELHDAVSRVYEKNLAERKALEEEIASLANRRQRVDLEAEVEAAMGQIEHLENLISNAEELAVAREIIELVNINLFLSFEDATWGKRTVRKVAGGVLTTGAAPLPIKPY